jgi:hypothetical protein
MFFELMHVPLLNSHFSARAVGKRLPRVLRSTRLAHMHTRTHAQLTTTTTTTTTMMMMIMTTLTLHSQELQQQAIPRRESSDMLSVRG